MITEKRCSKCGEVKPLNEFYKSNTIKDGYYIHCKQCDKNKSTTYKHTKKGLITAIYRNQKRSSKVRGYNHPTYTKEELKEWLFSQKLFHELFDNWKASNFDKMSIPSVDRINDYKGYSLDNIQLMSWEDNLNKAYSDMKKGINNKQSRAVLQFSVDGKFIAEYYSISNASRESGIHRANINSCCLGKLKIAGGYKWKYYVE